jgi:anhydro-N-acetylmuramic acid kinase
MTELYVGLMSGTSLDGVDAVLISSSPQNPPTVLQAVQLPYPGPLRAAVLALCQGQPVTLSQLGQLDVRLARWYAQAVQQLLQEAAVPAAQVRAIGCHGQTVHHEPLGEAPFTLQLGDPNTLAVLSGITVVADFRRRDMALGGQGAPLAPGFHDAVFRQPEVCTVVLNCGGIANISVLAPGQPCIGYDTGPANILMDAWVQQQLGQAFDRDGAWALQGQLLPALLAQMKADPYFQQAAPKSTGREYFNAVWTTQQLARWGAAATPADVQRTLLELSASTICDAIAQHASEGRLLVCGGGAHNRALLQRLQALAPSWQVASTASVGIAPEHVEAAAFAVFAQRTLQGLPGNLPSVTGASRPCLLGGIYPP